jgi:hypothetical protein
MLCFASADGCFRPISPAFSRTLVWNGKKTMTRLHTDFVHLDDRGAGRRELKHENIAGEKALGSGLLFLAVERSVKGRFRDVAEELHHSPPRTPGNAAGLLQGTFV